ncbi:hypothetical protein FRC09_003062 [Ceratobasidium sp. 395]|nr:hypothetical protein FRC09_003062 [Ceratobasidium sp. 395]
MNNGKKRNLEQESARGLKRIKLTSDLSSDAGPSTQSTQQANTPLMPEAGPQHTLEHTELPQMPPIASQSPNVESHDNTPNSPPVSILSVTPPVEQSAERERWGELRALAKTLGKKPNGFGPLKQAVEGIVAGVENFETVAQNRADYDNLRNDLNGLSHELAEFFDASTPPTMAPSIVNFSRGIDRELESVRLKLSETRIETRPADTDKVLEHYRRIQALLQRLTGNMRADNLRIADEQVTETWLKSLPHSPAAKYSSAESSDLRGPCTENTHAHILDGLYEWARNDKGQKICWLNGMASTGKTTIAYSFCEWLDRSKKLAASCFCSRKLPTCRDVNRIVPTISYQLSRFSRPFRSAISRVIQEDPDVHNQVILEQFKSLILQPLAQVKDSLPTDLVVVIDALDECDNEVGVDRILSALLSSVRKLPVKFFVTSRPDAKILDRMHGQHGENLLTELRLPEPDRPTLQGIINTPEERGSVEVSIHGNVTTISSTMPVSTIVTILTKRRCPNITEQLNLDSFDRTPISGGGFGDVFRGSLLEGEQVAVKCPRLCLQQDDEGGRKVLKRAARELYTWSQLEHKNIVKLLGLAEFRGQMAMLSPWMDNGTLLDYIRRNPAGDRYQLCFDISEGVTYLHQNDVIHGDIKSVMILRASAKRAHAN